LRFFPGRPKIPAKENTVRRLVLTFAALLFGCSTPPSPVRDLSGWRIPPGFKIVGYFPSWSGNPELVRYEALTHVNYAFALVDATGTFRPVEAPEKLTEVVGKARAAGVKVMVSVGGWNEGNTSAFDRIAADPVKTERFVTGARAFLDAFSLDGVDLDWEYPRAGTADRYATLVEALAADLHGQGRELSLAVSAAEVNGKYVMDRAWEAADWLNVMAYDDGWGGRTWVPHSSYSFTRAALDYWTGVRGVPQAKVVLGVPFYGRSLVDRRPRSYRSLLEEFPEAEISDVAGAFAYNGPDTLRAKVVNQARVRAGGVMVWQLNQDARGPASLLSLIYDTVKEPAE